MSEPFDVPRDVEADIARCMNVLQYLQISEMRLMACLDVIVSHWKKSLNVVKT